MKRKTITIKPEKAVTKDIIMLDCGTAIRIGKSEYTNDFITAVIDEAESTTKMRFPMGCKKLEWESIEELANVLFTNAKQMRRISDELYLAVDELKQKETLTCADKLTSENG